MDTITETIPATPAVGPALARRGRHLVAALRPWRPRRQTDARLELLDDYLLKDLGVQRNQNGRLVGP